MSTSNERGAAFEARTKAFLDELCDRFPDNISYQEQFRLKTHTGRTYIADFIIKYKYSFLFQIELLVECQSRKRSSPSIVDKMTRIQATSPYNIFVFLYEDDIPDVTSKALQDCGFQELRLDDLERLAASLENMNAVQQDFESSNTDGVIHIKSINPQTKPLHTHMRHIAVGSALIEIPMFINPLWREQEHNG